MNGGKKVFQIPSNVQWNEDILKRIIIEGDTKKLNEFCDKLGKYYSEEGLSTSQIRNIFDTVQNMKEYNEKDLQLLRPRLAYIAGRHEKKVPVIKHHLQPMMDKAIQLTRKENFENFKNFFEAIVAYHKYYGGSE